MALFMKTCNVVIEHPRNGAVTSVQQFSHLFPHEKSLFIKNILFSWHLERENVQCPLDNTGWRHLTTK